MKLQLKSDKHWKFEPVIHFDSKQSKSMYWSYLLSVWALIATVAPITVGVMIAQIGAGNIEVVAVVACTITSSLVFLMWMVNGVDLRRVSDQILAAIPAVSTLLLWALAYFKSDLEASTLIFSVLFLVSLFLITILGPVWVGLVYIALTIYVLFALGDQYLSNIAFLSFMMVLWWFSAKGTFWYINVLEELEEGRRNAARLAVAEERLRFSTDLHDVVGRSLSIIALKAELADALIERGDDRAGDQLKEIREVTNDAMAQMRTLVRGYRAPQLEEELQGARALLESAGIKVSVETSTSMLDEDRQNFAAFFIREAATNILRHSHATTAKFTITKTAISACNDGPILDKEQETAASSGTGIGNLRRKLVEMGLGDTDAITVEVTPEKFVLRAEWGSA